MWTNKHVVVAMLVAPILAIIGWFAVDYAVSEKPHAAQSGVDYPLAAKSNCRYESGACDLANGEFRLRIVAPDGNVEQLRLEFTSKIPLSAAHVGIAAAPGGHSSPIALTATAGDGTRWSGVLQGPAADQSVLRFIVATGTTRYYAEVPTTFLQAKSPQR